MKKLLPPFLSSMLLSAMLFAQNPSDTLALTTNFPDSAFRAQLLVKVDLNKDKKLQWSEVQGTHKLSFTSSSIKSLIGIEKFTNLDSLTIEQGAFTSLDLSKNEKMIYLDVHWTSMVSLSVSKKAPYVYIRASDNDLTSLDASDLSLLKTLRVGAQNLTYLNIQGTTLTYLNAFENPKVSVCVDSKTQWDAIPQNDLRKCLEDYGPQGWCNYELTCIITTDLDDAIISENKNLPYTDYDLLGQELSAPANHQVVIRRYANGKSEKRFVTE